MKRSIFIATVICFLILPATAGLAFAQSAAPSSGGLAPGSLNHQAGDLTALVKHLSTEVRALRLELCKLQLEFRQGKVAQLERELRQAQSDGRQMEVQERALRQDVAAIDQQLNDSTLAAEERKELEANKAEMLSGGLETLRAEQRTTAQRESELSKQLEQEQQRLQELLGKLKKLSFSD